MSTVIHQVKVMQAECSCLHHVAKSMPSEQSTRTRVRIIEMLLPSPLPKIQWTLSEVLKWHLKAGMKGIYIKQKIQKKKKKT